MPTTNLEKLHSQRIGTKRIIERFIEKLAEAREEDDMIEYEATIEAIQNKNCLLQSLNETILTQTDAEATEEEMLQSEEYSLDLDVKLRKFKRYLVQRSSQDNQATHHTGNTQHRNDNSSNNSGQPNPFPGVSTSNTSQFSRLPKLSLPKFDGDLLQWQSFWDSFDSSIHSNMNLSDVQKFGYLKAQLEGTAAMTVEGFALTNANYIRALELLRERYGQQSKIVHATMQALLNLPEPTSTVHSLRSFYDRMETYIRGLESLGQNQDMYGSLLVPIVIDKLPTDIRRNLARANENNDWILQDLRRAINKEINILETGSSNSRPEVPHNPTALFFTGTRETPSICSKNTQFQGRPEAAILYTDAGDTRPDVLLKTAVAEVGYNQYTTSANILLDEGAQRSFISKKLAEDLHLPRIGTDVIHVASFGKQSHDVRHLDKAEVFLKTDSGEKIKMHVLIIPTIAVPIQNRIQKQAATLPYLQKLKLAHPVTSDDVFEISFLIGADYYWKVVLDRVIRGNGPTAVKSKIGYLLSGPVNSTVNQHSSAACENYVMNVMTTAPPRVDDIDKFWKLESLGISSDENDETDVSVMRDYQQTHISFNDGKYEARLPWKQDHDPLPTNYEITKRRTESTIRRLSKDTKILNTYSDIIADQEKRGFIEKVPDEDLQRNNRQIHYIPHHAVKKDSDTTPVRIVYDCSCRQSPKLPSLNDCLQSTPPALNDLTSILVRFRLHEFAVATDIEKAFLHVGLHEGDRDVTRFLWLSDASDVNSPLQTYRFKAVLFGATCSPFILDATLQKHLQENSDN